MEDVISQLRSCTDIRSLRRVHAGIRKAGYIRVTFLGNLLVQMYGRCSSAGEAVEAFSALATRNVYSWISLVTAYALSGHMREAERVFDRMPERNVPAWNSMINVFGASSRVDDAKRLFDSMPQWELASWNTMLAAYARNGHESRGLKLFQSMILEGVAPNRITFLGILDACGSIGSILHAKLIHAEITLAGLELDVLVATSIIGTYGRCRSVQDARELFDRMPEKTVVSWTCMAVAYSQNGELLQAKLIFDSAPVHSTVSWSSMVSAYSQNGRPETAVLLFKLMDLEGFLPNMCTFTSALDACSDAGLLGLGRVIHSEADSEGFAGDSHVGAALINMYGRCSCPGEAKSVFDELPFRDEVATTALICAYVGDFPEALRAFRTLDLEGLKPKCITYVSILDSCDVLQAGMSLHERVRSSGLESNTVAATALICMYRRCNRIEAAKSVFDQLPRKNVITWTSMMVAYVESGCEREALKLFKSMDIEGTSPDDVVVSNALDACANLSDLVAGRAIERAVEQGGDILLEDVATSLIDMYGKCGRVEDAKSLLDKLEQPTVVTWTSTVTAYAENGRGAEAVRLFQLMELQGVEANEVSLVSVLCACSRSGMMDLGLSYFSSISRDRGLRVLPEHHACLVDLLARTGKLELAQEVVEQYLSVEVAAWTALLGACNVHGDNKRAKLVARRLVELDPNQASSYVLLSNVHASYQDSKKLRK